MCDEEPRINSWFLAGWTVVSVIKLGDRGHGKRGSFYSSESALWLWISGFRDEGVVSVSTERKPWV